MEKKEAIKTITTCASLYKDNLENKNLLFIFGTEQRVETLETVFLARNFLHLTGVKTQRNLTTSSDFYKKCLKGKLSPNDFELDPNGSTEMKLTVLHQLMNIHKTAKMIGDYDYSKYLLVTDKLVGNVHACLGFIREGAYLVPNTAIREDIRDVTSKPQKRILGILRKDVSTEQYESITYMAKGATLNEQLIKKIMEERMGLIISINPEQSEHKIEIQQQDSVLKKSLDDYKEEIALIRQCEVTSNKGRISKNKNLER